MFPCLQDVEAIRTPKPPALSRQLELGPVPSPLQHVPSVIYTLAPSVTCTLPLSLFLTWAALTLTCNRPPDLTPKPLTPRPPPCVA